jgi:hypothetical protein
MKRSAAAALAARIDQPSAFAVQIAVLFRVMFGGLAAVMSRVRRMTMSSVRMMRRLPVVTVTVVLCGFAMMMGRGLMVLRGGAVMFSAFVCRHDGLPCRPNQRRDTWRVW